MRFVAYPVLKDDQENSVKKDELIQDKSIFWEQLAEEKFPEVDEWLIYAAIDVISNCIACEVGVINTKLRLEGITAWPEMEVEVTKRLPYTLSEMGRLKEEMSDFDLQKFSKTSHFYKNLLLLYGHKLVTAEQLDQHEYDEYYTRSKKMFVASYGIDAEALKDVNKVRQITGEIFDIIKDAIERLLKGEMSKEELEICTSGDPDFKDERARLKPKYEKYLDSKVNAQEPGRTNKKVRFDENTKGNWTEIHPSKLTSEENKASHVDKLAKEIGADLSKLGIVMKL